MPISAIAWSFQIEVEAHTKLPERTPVTMFTAHKNGFMGPKMPEAHI
jgi:hypothetical protein